MHRPIRQICIYDSMMFIFFTRFVCRIFRSKCYPEVTFGAAITACRRVLRNFLGQPWLQLHDVAQFFASRQACHEMAKCPWFGEILSSKTRTFRLQMDEFRAKCTVVIMANHGINQGGQHGIGQPWARASKFFQRLVRGIWNGCGLLWPVADGHWTLTMRQDREARCWMPAGSRSSFVRGQNWIIDSPRERKRAGMCLQ